MQRLGAGADQLRTQRSGLLHRGERIATAREVLFGAFKRADCDHPLPSSPSDKRIGCKRQLIAVELHRISSVDSFRKRRNRVGVDVNKNFGAIDFVSTSVAYKSVEERGAFFSGGHSLCRRFPIFSHADENHMAAFGEKLIPARALAVLTLHHTSRDVLNRGSGQFPKADNGRGDVVRRTRPTKRKKGEACQRYQGSPHGSLPRHNRSYVTARYRIRQGRQPSDLLIEQPTKFEAAINLKTAKAIGVAVPETFFASCQYTARMIGRHLLRYRSPLLARSGHASRVG